MNWKCGKNAVVYFKLLAQNLPRGDDENHEVRIAGPWVQIGTKDLPNMNEECLPFNENIRSY
jgi:hypothetical protein